MWFINKRRRVRAQLKGGTQAARRTRKPRAHRAVQHREDTGAPANNPAVVGLCSDLDFSRGRSGLPNVQHDASDGLSSYCSQSAGTLSDGSGWSGLVSSDFEDHASACTSSCSTASTAPISPRVTDGECTDMLQVLEQCLGLTDKDIGTAPFDLPVSHCKAEKARVLQSARAVCPDESTGPSGPLRWRYLTDMLTGQRPASVNAQNACWPELRPGLST